MSFLHKATNQCRHFIRRIHEDNLFHLAASLSYSTLLTLVPFLIVTFYVLSLFPLFKGLGGTIQHLLLNYFVSGLSQSINSQLNHFVSQMGQLKLINISALVIVNLLMMNALVSTFDRIWHTKIQYNIALSTVVHVLIILLAPIIFASLLLLGPYLASLHFFQLHQSGDHFIRNIQHPITSILPQLSALFVFTLFNWLLPSCKVKFKYALLCGFITMALFELAKQAFVIYLSHVHTYQLIYGTLATIPLFLFWIYISWVIILLGTLICHLLH